MSPGILYAEKGPKSGSCVRPNGEGRTKSDHNIKPDKIFRLSGPVADHQEFIAEKPDGQNSATMERILDLRTTFKPHRIHCGDVGR